VPCEYATTDDRDRSTHGHKEAAGSPAVAVVVDNHLEGGIGTEVAAGSHLGEGSDLVEEEAVGRSIPLVEEAAGHKEAAVEEGTARAAGILLGGHIDRGEVAAGRSSHLAAEVAGRREDIAGRTSFVPNAKHSSRGFDPCLASPKSMMVFSSHLKVDGVVLEFNARTSLTAQLF
jgi:hypothetical protein